MGNHPILEIQVTDKSVSDITYSNFNESIIISIEEVQQDEIFYNPDSEETAQSDEHVQSITRRG